jgi:hypothetical protein
MVIVLAAATGAVGIVALVVATLGWFGLLLAAFGIVAVSGVYRLWIQPWQHRWGATDDEVRRAMRWRPRSGVNGLGRRLSGEVTRRR